MRILHHANTSLMRILHAVFLSIRADDEGDDIDTDQ